MALLLPHVSFVPSPSSSRPAAALRIPSTLSLRLQEKLDLHPRSFNGVKFSRPSAHGQRRMMIVHASSETDGNEVNEPGAASSEGPKESASVESLPLESKLKLMAEQKLKMKLAKKIRLRRKRLVRKRHLRKKGRWPPSKMKKLKNV